MAKSTNAVRRPGGLQVARNGPLKPRIIHTYSPKVYKIKPEEFLDLVQKLTGRTDTGASTSTSGFDLSENAEMSNFLQDHELATPLSTQLLASLPSPRLETLNFLPMLASTPRTPFPIPSAAY